MSRTPKKVFSKAKNTRGRNFHIDFDYVDKLSPEEQKWLAQFTDEYYGAGFKINPTFVKKNEFLLHMESIITTEKNPIKKIKLEAQLVHYKKVKGVYLQISEHPKRSFNVDLRKMRAITKYYRTPKGKLSPLPKYKYSSENIQVESNLKDCNDRANSIREDAYSNWYRNEMVGEGNSDIDQMLEMHSDDELSHEEKIILMEKIKEERELRGLE